MWSCKERPVLYKLTTCISGSFQVDGTVRSAHFLTRGVKDARHDTMSMSLQRVVVVDYLSDLSGAELLILPSPHTLSLYCSGRRCMGGDLVRFRTSSPLQTLN